MRFFFRTNAGAEVDLVITKSEKPVLCVDIKLSLSPLPARGFFNAMDDLKCKEGIVIYPGNDEYSIRKNVKVVPVSKLDKYLHG